jgi:simple sugar transport system ATP-binding protein
LWRGAPARIQGSLVADFRKGEKSREELLDLMAGGEAMAELEVELATLTG